MTKTTFHSTIKEKLTLKVQIPVLKRIKRSLILHKNVLEEFNYINFVSIKNVQVNNILYVTMMNVSAMRIINFATKLPLKKFLIR